MYSILIYKACVLLTYDSVFFSLKCQYGDVKNMYQIIDLLPPLNYTGVGPVLCQYHFLPVHCYIILVYNFMC